MVPFNILEANIPVDAANLSSLRGFSFLFLFIYFPPCFLLVLIMVFMMQQLVIYETSASELDIIRDISRTFPSHVFFQQRHGPGQRSLYNVLKAYSVYDRDVGYVQV